MGSLNLQSPAKINLYLRVLGKRPDGFHDLDSAFQLIDLYDNIEMSDTDSSEVIIECEPSIIKSEDNIILKAINDLKKDYKINNGIKIKLQKNIPIGYLSNIATTSHFDYSHVIKYELQPEYYVAKNITMVVSLYYFYFFKLYIARK